MPPKADQEEPDIDDDADKFDKHLFEVRKLYKKPEDDRLTAEDISKVKDAIDRCLNAYRTIKQDEVDEKDRNYRIRRRKEDMAKRAEKAAETRRRNRKILELIQKKEDGDLEAKALNELRDMLNDSNASDET